MKRKHADLIHAWADGAQIQSRNNIGEHWQDNHLPVWANDTMYRIKPEPKPDVVKFTTLWQTNGYDMSEVGQFCLTWDGETGKLKSAEVV